MVTCSCGMKVPTLKGHACFKRGEATPVKDNPDRTEVLRIENEPLVSNRAKERRAKLHEALHSGENIFSHIIGQQVDSTVILQRKKLQEAAKLLAEQEETERLQALDKYWRSGGGPVKPYIMFTWDSPIAKMLGFSFPPDPNPDLTKLTCSFCGSETPEITTTRGVTRIRRFTKQELVKLPDGTVEIREKIVHVPKRVIACRACVNHIKPLIDKDGKIIHRGFEQVSIE